MASNRDPGRFHRRALFILALSSFLPAAPTLAAVLYVSPGGGGSGAAPESPTTLQAALDAAEGNGEPDVLHLRTGTYATSGTPFRYEASATDQVSLLGGWDDAFTTRYRGMDPLLMTALDGGNQNRVLEVTSGVSGVTVTITLENLALLRGKATDTHGAGLRLNSAGGGLVEGYIRRCLFKGNRGQTAAPATSGGGMFSNSWFEMTDSVFSDNAANAGGGLNVSAAPPYTLAPVIDRCTFDNNATLSVGQGGSDINNSSSLTIRNSRFSGKTDGTHSGGGAVNHAGGGDAGAGTLTVVNSVLSGKKSWYWGAGIHIWDANARIVNTLFAGNTAGTGTDDYGRGGGIAIYDPSPASARTVDVLNCTFVKNRSEGARDGLVGMAIDNRVQTLRVVNSVFWDNGATAPLNNAGGTVSVTHSDVQHGYAGTGNLDVDPAFADFAGGNYHLTNSSPCRDSGTENPLGTFIYELYPTSSDLDGRDRMMGGVDMGAYELDTGPHAGVTGRGDPALARDADLDRFLAAYSSWDGTGKGRLLGRLIYPDGSPAGDEFPIDEQGSYQRILSAVAYDAALRKFLVFWDLFNASSNDSDLHGQVVNPDGSLEGWNFVVTGQAGVGERNPAAAYGATSRRTMVVWDRKHYPTDESDVAGRLYLDGLPLGGEFPVANLGGVTESGADLAHDPVGDRFLVAWTDDRSAPTSAGEVWARRFDADGNPVGDGVQVTETAGASRPGDQREPAVAYNPSAQHFLVAWADDGGEDFDVNGRIVGSDGALQGTVFPIASGGGNQEGVALACGGDPARFLALWQDDGAGEASDIRGAWLHHQGSPRLVEFAVADDAGTQTLPRVAAGASGLLGIWETAPPSGPPDFDVAYRRIAGLVSLEMVFPSVGAGDGWVRESSETSGRGGTMKATGTSILIGDDAADRQYRGILSFDTSPLPDDATVIWARLKVKYRRLVGSPSVFRNHGALQVDLKQGSFSNSPRLQPQDFQDRATRSAVAFLDAPVAGGSPWHDAPLDAAAAAKVNRKGLTQLRLGFAKGDDDDRKADYLDIYSGNSPADSKPVLEVIYTLP
jgi:hypothetical protein